MTIKSFIILSSLLLFTGAAQAKDPVCFERPSNEELVISLNETVKALLYNDFESRLIEKAALKHDIDTTHVTKEQIDGEFLHYTYVQYRKRPSEMTQKEFVNLALEKGFSNIPKIICNTKSEKLPGIWRTAYELSFENGNRDSTIITHSKNLLLTESVFKRNFYNVPSRYNLKTEFIFEKDKDDTSKMTSYIKHSFTYKKDVSTDATNIHTQAIDLTN